MKTTHLKEKLVKLEEEMAKLATYEKQRLAATNQQISLTDPDSRSMATSECGSGVVGYNVQVASMQSIISSSRTKAVTMGIHFEPTNSATTGAPPPHWARMRGEEAGSLT